MPAADTAVVLELRDASKSFGRSSPWPGAIEVEASIHALVGENGAGKSTLVKIVAGVYRPTPASSPRRPAGRLRLDGREAKDAGIAVIYQEPTLFPDLTSPRTSSSAASPGRRPASTGPHARRDRRAFRRLGVPIDPDRPRRGPLHRRPADHRDRQGDLADARVLVMDEPTGSLSGEKSSACSPSPAPARRGTAIVFISHRLEEIFASPTGSP